MNGNLPRRPLTPAVARALETARRESLGMEARSLNCPYCGFRIQTLFSDAAGHVQAKCRKCKAETVFDLTHRLS